jgi:hypothetical protein
MLRHCGSDAAIPVLAPELGNPELSHFVRLVFQGLETPEADKALAKTLPKSNDDIKVGIIGTLGQRGSSKSVKAIKPYLSDTNTEIQLAAIIALGNIGGKDATEALTKAKVNPELSNEWKRSQLKCAGTLDDKTAMRAYRKFLAEGNDNPIRAEALVGMTTLAPAESITEVCALLDADNTRLKQIAIGLLPILPAEQLTERLVGMAPENQIWVINALSNRTDPAAESAVLKLTANENEAVRDAAFKALGTIGRDASTQPLLAAAADNEAHGPFAKSLRTEIFRRPQFRHYSGSL